MKKIIKAIKDPYWAFGVFLRKILSRFLSDETFIKWEYFFWGGGFNLKKGWTKPDTFYCWVNEAGREGINGRNTARIFCFLSY